ncbi:MAG: hypothetical protein LKG25_09680 [Prevotella sp.]|jgi:hypothetical protein|nr:hypothetical protein [Prevotella sp.]MCI1282844.1 hypothetical protein [Prevotella sp.]
MKQKLLIILLSFICFSAKAQEDSTYISTPILPYNYGWGWHKGLNVDVDLSVFAQFGKNARHGAGFEQRLSATYLAPLSKKLWLAAGGSVNNIMWSGDSYRSAAFYAAIGYKFNEHWEAYAWVQKQVASNNTCGYYSPYYNYMFDMPYNGMFGYGDRIGAAVKYNLNPNVSFQLSVEGVNIPKQKGLYFDQYNYPTPKD